MAIRTDSALWLAAVRRLGVDFSSTLMLGRQEWLANPTAVSSGLRELGVEVAPAELESPDGFADHYLRVLGASDVQSLDASGYQGAQLIADLNASLAPTVRSAGPFSVVLDGGTTEHVVAALQAQHSAMSLVAEGGHLLSITPTNGQSGHGFYQFSPQLYWGLQCPDNGYEGVSMLVNVSNNRRHPWHRLTRPADDSVRVGWNRPGIANLHVVARRIGEVPDPLRIPQQSDYQVQWEPEQPHRPIGKVSRSLASRLPTWLRLRLGHWRLGWWPRQPGVTRCSLTELQPPR